MALALGLVLGALGARAGAPPGTAAVATVEHAATDDARLESVALGAECAPLPWQMVATATSDRVAVDYAPAPRDIVSRARHRTEQRSALEFKLRGRTDRDFSPTFGLGGYRGFTDFRSVWLAEYYRQLFEVVPGYIAASPRGWHAVLGGRWDYRPGNAVWQATLVRQGDRLSPAYEPQIGGPLRRGRESLHTTALRLSAENVLAPTVRTLLETGATTTTGRATRWSVQGSLNWSAGERWTVRTVVAGVRERPAFQAESLAWSLEHDWAARWFAGVLIRGYRDRGEVVDPLLVSTAAPAQRTRHLAVSVRRQGERSAWRLEAGPYQSRYQEVALASAQFARLYRNRHWLRVQGTASWQF